MPLGGHDSESSLERPWFLTMAAGIAAPHTVRLRPVGTCIYCGSTAGRLTDEHIIPQGLGGTLVLEKASCDPCAQVTSRFEMDALRGFLDHGRQALGIKGRKSHKRKPQESVPQTFLLSDEALRKGAASPEQSVRVMHLPVFVLPAFLDPDRPISIREGIEVMAIATATFGPAENSVVREPGAVGMQFNDRMNVVAFGRMLAKIAHGYHVAVHGLFPLEESPLVPIILGKRWDAHNWIGNTEHEPLPSDRPALHLLQHLPLEADGGIAGMAVRIKLFASFPSPNYALATRLHPMPPHVDY